MKQQNSTYNTTEKTYNSINEMPMFNWNEILSTGDLKYIFKECKGRVSEKIADLWYELQDQYIERFGLDEKFIKKLRLLKEKADLNYEFILTKDKFINTRIGIVDADLKALDSGASSDVWEVKDQMEKYKGYAINLKTITVTEWGVTLKNMSNNG